MLKRDVQSVPGAIAYLDERSERRNQVVATAVPLPSGGYLVFGPQDTIVSVGSEQEADRIADRFGFALSL